MGFGMHSGRRARDVLYSEPDYVGWVLSVHRPRGALWGLRQLAEELRRRAVVMARWRMARYWVFFRAFLWRMAEKGATRRGQLREPDEADIRAFRIEFDPPAAEEE